MNDRKTSCAFTGHRPERLSLPESEVISWLEEQIKKAVDEGYTTFITGMAKGVDIWATEEVLKLKENGTPVKLIAASAFKNMEDRWERDWQERYRNILEKADEVHYVSAVPGRQAFFKRNNWMVDRASKLIAVYTGAPGGTARTIEYAEKCRLDIVRM